MKNKKIRSMKKIRWILLGMVMILVGGLWFNEYRYAAMEKKAREIVAEASLVEFYYRYPNTFTEFALMNSKNGRVNVLSKAVYKKMGDMDQSLSFLLNTSSELITGSFAGKEVQGIISQAVLDSPQSLETYVEENSSVEVSTSEFPTFYHPAATYEVLPNDYGKLANYQATDLIELGISFQHGYTEQELYELLEFELRPTFYWINAYDEEKLQEKPKTFRKLIGYQGGSAANDLSNILYPDKSISDGASYIDSLLQDLNSEQCRFIDKKVLNDWGNDEFREEVLSGNKKLIIGITLIGTPEELLKTQDKLAVRASSIGMISEKK